MIIGRLKEQEQMAISLQSNHAEFVVVYGRRRIGKTFLVKEYFKEQFSFYSTGVLSRKSKDELMAFYQSLKRYGYTGGKCPKSWFDAFEVLRNLIENDTIKIDSRYNKRIIFLDELPWMDTFKSDFKGAFDFFWNSFASTQKNLVLIVCGSATSWIINNLLNTKGGFYNRVTRRIHLDSFNLNETKMLVNNLNNNDLSNDDIIKAYMIFGGVPYYLNFIDSSFSLIQNIDNLLFKNGGQLENEFENLFSSLFNNYSTHIKIIEALSNRTKGLTRNEIIEISKLNSGESINKALSELDECGFIRKYNDYKTSSKNSLYQIIDPFTLFAFNHLMQKKVSLWQNYVGSPSYYSWCGRAFEIVCLNHIDEMKEALGISGIDSLEYSFYQNKKGGAQIDLLIDRKDSIINLCEMKYSDNEFVISDDYKDNILNKVEVFKAATKTKKTIAVTFVTINGVSKNKNYSVVRKEININDLMK